MRKVITMLFAAALLSTAYVAVAAEAEPLDKSTHPDPMPSNADTETINQKPDAAPDQPMDSDMSNSGSSGSSDMGNDTTDPNTEKLRQEPK